MLLLLLYHLQDTPDGPWSLKDKAGFIQTPQDFWNVDASDPLVHSARFFYVSELRIPLPCMRRLCGAAARAQRRTLCRVGYCFALAG
jgi:hypothetical protein